MLNLGFILENLFEYTPTGDEPIIAKVVIDSRQVQPGCLFIAFQGEHADGHDFVEDAFRKGAVAALIEKPVGSDLNCIDTRTQVNLQSGQLSNFTIPFCILVPSTLEALQLLGKAWRQEFNDIRVIGITGSVGKTTTKELTHAVLSTRFRTLKSEGNYNNEIGLPLTLLSLRPWHQKAVLEMGMYTTGEISLLCDLAHPHVGVVTIVGSVHMEWLGSIERITAAKKELVEALPPAPEGVAILNMDDPRVMSMADATQARIITYGLSDQADLWAENIVSMGLDGIRFTLHYEGDNLYVQVPLLGRHSVHTALRAAAVGLVEGLAWDDIVRGLRSLSAQLRLVAVPGPNDSIILDDTYNSSPESAIAALNLLADLDGRRIAVLGDMLELGPVEEASHRLVGRRAREVAQVLVSVGTLGRIIGQEALRVGMLEANVYFSDNAQQAVAVLEKLVQPGDVILVKGSRGIQLDEVVATMGEG